MFHNVRHLGKIACPTKAQAPFVTSLQTRDFACLDGASISKLKLGDMTADILRLIT
jgi:hypothetical protein